MNDRNGLGLILALFSACPRMMPREESPHAYRGDPWAHRNRSGGRGHTSKRDWDRHIRERTARKK